ncbi:MAG: hypothetical protein M3R25_13960 [Bacteroidota bacterium]|nr:hypothetical protein [Bacteroidota bacterium]
MPKLPSKDDYKTEILADQFIFSSDIERIEISYLQLFNTYAPLDRFPLIDQNILLSSIANTISSFTGNESKAIHNYNFWKSYKALEFEPKSYSYETKIKNVSNWKLEVSKEGLIYYDLSHHFNDSNIKHEQTLSDFWFYGPLFPIPSYDLRVELVELLKSAFIDVGFPYPQSHYEVIQYPSFISPPTWSDGDYEGSEFVMIRDYGIEYGTMNFHDGLTGLSFISHEHCLNRNDLTNLIFTSEIRNAIIEMIRGVREKRRKKVRALNHDDYSAFSASLCEIFVFFLATLYAIFSAFSASLREIKSKSTPCLPPSPTYQTAHQ